MTAKKAAAKKTAAKTGQRPDFANGGKVTQEPLCAVAGCDALAHRGGLCAGHWGSPELVITTPIDGKA